MVSSFIVAQAMYMALVVQSPAEQPVVSGSPPGEPAQGPAPATQPAGPEVYPQPAPAAAPQPQAQPQPPPPPPPPPERSRKGLGLLISGWSLFGGSYLITALAGAIAYDTGNEPLGGALLIPIAGPLIAMPQVDSLSGRIGLAFPFLAQTAGVAMGITGAVLLARSRRANRAQAINADGVRLTRAGLRLNAGPTRSGGAFALTYRF